MGFWRSGRDQDESKLAPQPKSEPDQKPGPNAGQIEVAAGISLASSMLQALILSEYIDHVRSDLEKPENRIGRYSNSAEQRRLLDCAATYAWADKTDAADMNWVLELEGMDLAAYKVALHDLLPTILAYTDRQRIAVESVQAKQIAEQATGLRAAIYTAQFDLSATAFNTLEQRERQW